MSFDPNKKVPPGRPCLVLDAMARDLASAAGLLQRSLPSVAQGNYQKVRDEMFDIPALAPARQYLLGLMDGRSEP